MIQSSTPFVDAWRAGKAPHSTWPRIPRQVESSNSSSGADPCRSTPTRISRSISAQRCNAACPFCVEELRPASRGIELNLQKRREANDEIYFDRLSMVLEALWPLRPSISITGGEPSKDFRLPRILRTLGTFHERKRTLTTNGSGLLDVREGKRIIDWIADSSLDHLNISVAHSNSERNARIMRLPEVMPISRLREIVQAATAAAVRARLSCVLIRSGVSSLADIFDYLKFARSIGIDNVIFRQLMRTDPQTHAMNSVVRYSERQRVRLEPLLDEISTIGRFTHVRQIVGYYYYVEVWNYEGMDVVFEEADLAQLEAVKRRIQKRFTSLSFIPAEN